MPKNDRLAVRRVLVLIQEFYAFLAKINTPKYICAPLEGIVKLSGYSHSHLCKIFKQNTGKTLKDYHNQLKMEYATSLLLNNNLSLLDISNILGYSSLSHFIKIFKTHTAYTPKQYRKLFVLNKDFLPPPVNETLNFHLE